MFQELKICLLGDSGVGKSSIVQRFVHNTYTRNKENTIGASFMSKTIVHNKETYKLCIWDTAGQERYRALTPMYYRNSASIIIVYSIDSKQSFDSLKSWLKELKLRDSDKLNVLAIAGNKVDIKEKRQVTYKDGKAFADEYDAIFFETSAKTGQCVNDLFFTIVSKIPKNSNNPNNLISTQQTTTSLTGNSNKSSGCCNGGNNDRNIRL